MVQISRIRVAWSGWPGGPGVSTFFTAAPPTSAQLTAVRTLFDGLKNSIPSGITMQVESTGQQIDTTTGKAVDVWTGPAQTVVTATGSGAYHAAGGFMIRWNTGVFNNGRLLKGKTYIVPCVVSHYGTDGTIENVTLNSLQGFVNTFITSMAGGLAIYSRRYATSTTATSGTVVDKAMVMTSRRA
jgi:hypothetical protein